ncbi:MAG TPA: glycosyltransferase family 4 protein [Nitrososphaerales archaeon]
MRVGVIMYQTSQTKGQELVAQRMVKELRRQGHEAYLITSIFHDQTAVVSREEVSRRGGYIHMFDSTLGLPVVRVNSEEVDWPPRRIAFVGFMSVLTALIDELKLDVLVTHSTLWNGPEDAARFVEWKRNQAKGGAPVGKLVFCHMSHFQEPSEERYDLDERTYRQTWNGTTLPMVMKLADFVLVTTPYERELMKKMGVEDSKLVLFPGGVDILSLEPSDLEFRKKHGIPAEPKVVAYLGTVEERKNAKAVLKVAQVLNEQRDIHFVIAGRLEGEYGSQVKEASTGLANVTVTGPISDEDYPSLIREAYLNINMSRSEALGLAQLEFMYSGVPVVTSGVGGQSWVVKDGASGVVLSGPDDVSGAARAIRNLVDKPKKRNKLAQRSRDTASQFTMGRLIHSFIQIVSPDLGTEDDGAQAQLEPGDKVIEAWAKKGYKVVVTTRTLKIESGKKRQQVAIPFSEITRLEKRREFSWKIPTLGGLGSLAIYSAFVLDPSKRGAFDSFLAPLSSISPGILGGMFWLTVFLPLGLSLVVAALTTVKGYSIMFGDGLREFLPAEFAKALRIADEFTPHALFPPDSPP